MFNYYPCKTLRRTTGLACGFLLELNTLKHSIKYLLNVNKRINMNGKEIQELYERSEKEKLENHSVEEYYDQFDKEYEEFVKKMEE